MKNAISLFIFVATTILSLASTSSISSSVVSATSLRHRPENITVLNVDTIGIISLLPKDRNGGSCDTLTTCRDCTSTYTCHWCELSQNCHARGSIYGCAWGNTCSKNIKPPKKENNTCASQATCSDCALASRFCHWCEHDNACHAVGSRFGCSIGVDCYSNDRCRRSDPEPFPLPSSPIKAAIAALNRVPATSFVAIIFLGIILFGCLNCCFCFESNIKGASDDLVEITISARVAPMIVIDDAHFTRLGEFPDEVVLAAEGNEHNHDCDTKSENENNNYGENMGCIGSAPMEQPSQISQQCDELPPAILEAQHNNNQQQQQPTEDRNYPYFLMDGTRHNAINRYQLQNQEHETCPLLQPSFNGTIMGAEDPTHMKRLHWLCSALYYISVFIVVLAVGVSLLVYPQIPLYNVCNDEVAWVGIMKNIVAFKFDASFEILASLSNPNRIAAALDRGKGSFSFDGKEFGTFEIPPVSVDPMTITDFMIIVHISPADKMQAIQLTEAYYMGKLILNAEFEGIIRVPALFDYSREITAKNITVDINAASDRSLCQCPTWKYGKNHSTSSLLQLIENQSSLL